MMGQNYKQSIQASIGNCLKDEIRSVATNEDVFLVLAVGNTGAQLASSDLGRLYW